MASYGNENISNYIKMMKEIMNKELDSIKEKELNLLKLVCKNLRNGRKLLSTDICAKYQNITDETRNLYLCSS